MNATTDRAYRACRQRLPQNRSEAAARAPPLRRFCSLFTVARHATARPAAMTILRRRAARGKEVPERIPERLGIAAVPRPEGPLFWFHAASVGETNAVLPLIHELKQLYPALNILLTTVTVTSAQIAAERLPAGAIHQFVPLDSAELLPALHRSLAPGSRPVYRVRDLAEPDRRGKRPQGSLVLVNARMSDNPASDGRCMPSLSKPGHFRVSISSTQNFRIAKRLTGLGARKAVITGNLKYDAPRRPFDPAAAEVLRRSFDGRPVFLAASTHPGEDEAVARVAEILQSTIPHAADGHRARAIRIAARLSLRFSEIGN